MILWEEQSQTKRKMLLIHTVTFLFEPSGKDIVIKPHIYLSEVIEFLKSLHPRTGSLADWREDDISCQVVKHVTDTWKDTPASLFFERIVSCGPIF